MRKYNEFYKEKYMEIRRKKSSKLNRAYKERDNRQLLQHSLHSTASKQGIGIKGKTLIKPNLTDTFGQLLNSRFEPMNFPARTCAKQPEKKGDKYMEDNISPDISLLDNNQPETFNPTNIVDDCKLSVPAINTDIEQTHKGYFNKEDKVSLNMAPLKSYTEYKKYEVKPPDYTDCIEELDKDIQKVLKFPTFSKPKRHKFN